MRYGFVYIIATAVHHSPSGACNYHRSATEEGEMEGVEGTCLKSQILSKGAEPRFILRSIFPPSKRLSSSPHSNYENVALVGEKQTLTTQQDK